MMMKFGGGSWGDEQAEEDARRRSWLLMEQGGGAGGDALQQRQSRSSRMEPTPGERMRLSWPNNTWLSHGGGRTGDAAGAARTCGFSAAGVEGRMG
jgi:hypothetical protein